MRPWSAPRRTTCNRGAAWAFKRTNGSLAVEGPKLIGPQQPGESYFGRSVALSADGATALIGAPAEDGHAGSAWAFDDAGEGWTQQGGKLAGAGESGPARFGFSVALSGDGSTALVGGRTDEGGAGAAWAFARGESEWTQQGPKLTAEDGERRRQLRLQHRAVGQRQPRADRRPARRRAARGGVDVRPRRRCVVPAGSEARTRRTRCGQVLRLGGRPRGEQRRGARRRAPRRSQRRHGVVVPRHAPAGARDHEDHAELRTDRGRHAGDDRRQRLPGGCDGPDRRSGEFGEGALGNEDHGAHARPPGGEPGSGGQRPLRHLERLAGLHLRSRPRRTAR